MRENESKLIWPPNFRGVLSYTQTSRVVLVEYTLQEKFQTETALLAWSSQYTQNELRAHIAQILHFVRNPSTRGLLRPLSGPRAGVMLFRRVQGGKATQLSESLPSGTSTKRKHSVEGEGFSGIEEEQSTSDNSQQLHTGNKLRKFESEETGQPGTDDIKIGDHRGVRQAGSKGLSRSPCRSNACYHTTPPLAFDKLFGPGSDQSTIGIGDLGKQFAKPKPAIIKAKRQAHEERISSIDRINDLLPRVREFNTINCISCQREFVGPFNFKYCSSCFANRRNLL